MFHHNTASLDNAWEQRDSMLLIKKKSKILLVSLLLLWFSSQQTSYMSKIFDFNILNCGTINAVIMKKNKNNHNDTNRLKCLKTRSYLYFEQKI